MGDYSSLEYGSIEFVNGVTGTAASFDESSHIDVGDFNFNHENYTIKLWVKTDNITSYEDYNFLSKHGNTNAEIMIRRLKLGGYACEFSTDENFYPMTDENLVGLVNPSGDIFVILFLPLVTMLPNIIPMEFLLIRKISLT